MILKQNHLIIKEKNNFSHIFMKLFDIPNIILNVNPDHNAS